MSSSPWKKRTLINLSLAMLIILLCSSCNLPAELGERFFGGQEEVEPTPVPTYTPQPLPPAIVESDPLQGSTISLREGITIYFNQDMDPDSVQRSLHVEPGITGTITWLDQAAMLFEPDEALPPAETIQVRLDTGAAAANGLTLTEEAGLIFHTPDLLAPITFLPSPASFEIDPESAILVAFNQPVVALGESLQTASGAFEISPQVSGKGEWINTSTYQFIPDPGLAGGVTYQVSLSPSLTSLWGSALDPAADTTWSFSTSYPQVSTWEPYDGKVDTRLDDGIRMEFNQAMDKDSVENFFSLIVSGGGEVPGEFIWDDDGKGFTFQPKTIFFRNTIYSANLPGETKSAGGTPLALDTAFSFTTTGDFIFLGTPQGQNYATSIYEGATLYFNNPVDQDTVEENIAIRPEVSNLRPSSGGSSNVLTLYGDYEPLTTYTLTLREGLADIWGSEQGVGRVIQFTTQPLDSNLTITQGNNVLFLTGEENAIPAVGTNLHQVSINIGSIPENDLPQFFSGSLYQTLEDYYPADTRVWTHVVSVPGDDKYTVNLPLNQNGLPLLPGVYRYQIYSQELPYNPSPYLLAVSNIHLTLKTSPGQLMVWAVDLRTGLPVSNLDLEIFLSSGGAPLYTGTTDQDGVFLTDFDRDFDIYKNVFYAVSGKAGQENFGIAASNWSFGTEPYMFGLRSDYGEPLPLTYIYTDRPIYRPGQTVYYRLIQRDREDGGYTLPEADTIPVTIYRGGGVIETDELSLSDFGTASGEIQISPYADPGYYRIETDNGMIYYQVASYRKPEIKLDLFLEEEEALAGDEIEVGVEADYYFDAPVGGLPLNWSLQAVPTSFRLPGYRVGVLGSNWFVYSGIYAPNIWGTRIEAGEGQTDEDGKWDLNQVLEKINIYDREVQLPANYTFEITAEDETGFLVSNRSTVLVHPSDFYIGVKPSAMATVAEEGVDFEVLVVDWDKNPDGIKQLTAEFSKVTWTHTIGEIGEIEYVRQKEPVAELDFSTNSRGEASVTFTPPEPGTYQLDVFGEGARTEVTLWVGGTGSTTWPVQTNQKVKLIPDKDSYQPGDTARVFIPNPFPDGAAALVTIERYKVLSHQSLLITGAGKLLEIELGEENAPNVYLSVTMIGEDPEEGLSFRQGYLNLLVEPDQHLLNVEVIGEPERLGPGDEVEFTIRVTDQEGGPVSGEFSLAVVDQAVLALVERNTAPIGDAFYGIQPISVRMGFPLGMHAGRLVWVPGGMGGGGGDVDFSVRDEFEDTGYWQADIVTDQNGQAQVTFTLPDNLTTWQADARGITTDSMVGEGTGEVVTSKDLLVRPVTPRFLVAGDHLALAAVVHNNTTQELTAAVSLTAVGVRLDDPDRSSQNITLPPGGRERVEWWGTVEEIDEVELIFAADAGSYQDAVTPYQGALPVYRYTAPISYGTSGVLSDPGQELEIVTTPRTYDPTAGSLEIELSPSLSAAVLKALDALEEEQIHTTVASTYRFLPNVVTYQTLVELGLEYPQLESRLEALIPDTLDRLSSSQNEDGGWGWWSGGSSDPEITSYILFGLVKAQETGIFVDENMTQQARGYLLATLPALEMLSEPWQYNLLALRYFALTEAGIDVSAGARDLAAVSTELDPAGQAFLALAIEKGDPGNTVVQSILSNLEGRALRTATGAHWENDQGGRSWMNNTVTSTAIAAYALASTDRQGTLAEAIRYLISTRTPDGDWRSAYETGWAVLALNQSLRSSGELESKFDFSAAVNGTDLITGQADGAAQLESVQASLPVERLYRADPNALVITHGEGSGNLYYKAHLFLNRPVEDVQPFGYGLSVSRTYISARDGVVSFTQAGEKGELIQVKLTLVVENDSYYLQIEDHIPAGAEILDSRLLTTRQDLEEFQVEEPFNAGWGWWYFMEPKVYDDHVVWAATYLPAGTYQMSYTISLIHPGEFQVLPARAWQVYFPEVQAVSAGETFTIKNDQ